MSSADTGLILAQAMLTIAKVGGPPLLAALVVGVAIALFQAVTQINETTLAFIPKLLALGLTMVLTGSFMFATLSAYTRMLFDRMIALGGS